MPLNPWPITLESESLFRWGMVSFLAIFVIDVIVAWALYVVFRRVSQELSLVTAWFRIVYTVFLGVALIFFYQSLQLISGAQFLTAFDPGQLEAQALVALDAFNSAWLVGLLAFGVHLVLLGLLLLRSDYAAEVAWICPGRGGSPPTWRTLLATHCSPTTSSMRVCFSRSLRFLLLLLKAGWLCGCLPVAGGTRSPLQSCQSDDLHRPTTGARELIAWRWKGFCACCRCI